MQIYDITLPLSEELPVWPGDPKISIIRSSSLEKGDDANVTQMALCVHAGTHIDAPCHFEPEGVGIEQLPLDLLIGRCRLVEISDRSESIDRASLENHRLAGVTRILFKTRNSTWWHAGDEKFHTDFVHLTTGGAKYLLSLGIKLIGIDYLSIEKFENKGHPVHHLLLKNKVIILEGLNLYDVPAGDYELIALPLKLKGADGAPTRVILRECPA